MSLNELALLLERRSKSGHKLSVSREDCIYHRSLLGAISTLLSKVKNRPAVGMPDHSSMHYLPTFEVL